MIRLAFYKYTKKPINLGISLWTWLPNIGTPSYSHVEIGFIINGHWRYFSSTLRDGAKGTRWISSEKMLKHPERWDIYEIKNHRSEDKMIEIANENEGIPYDMLGIFGFVIPFLNDRNKWYCSEICWMILTGDYIGRISPRKMYKLARKECGLKLLNGSRRFT